jgi:hypothetical protein
MYFLNTPVAAQRHQFPIRRFKTLELPAVPRRPAARPKHEQRVRQLGLAAPF